MQSNSGSGWLSNSKPIELKGFVNRLRLAHEYGVFGPNLLAPVKNGIRLPAERDKLQ